MWPAWDDERVSKRHLEHAQKAAAKGLLFRPLAGADRTDADQLLANSIGEFAPMNPKHGAIVATDATGLIIGCIAMGEIFGVGQGTVVMIRGLAVEPAWRGNGVGVALLHIAKEQVRGPGNTFHVGNCAPGLDARFYQRAGFSVLDPYQPLAIPLAPASAPAWEVPPGAGHPCWFSRLS